MKITRISVWQLDLPLHKPYYLSGGRLKFECLDSTFVRIDTDEDISGWGEGCPWGVTYLPAFGKGIRAGIEELAPLLIGQDPRLTDSINRRMDLALPGHPYIKSAIDIACWDIAGKSANLPICVDEALHSYNDIVRIQSEGIAELVNIKINRVGGLTKARRIRDFCLQTGITMLIMDSGGSVVADTSCAHLAQTIPQPSCLGVWSCQEMVSVDTAPGQGTRNIEGCFVAPDLPGLGVEPGLAVLGDPVAVYR